MDWSFYSSEGKPEETVQFWSGQRPEVQKMVERHNIMGLINALTYEDASVRCAAAEGLARIGATDAICISRTVDGGRATMGPKPPAARESSWKPIADREELCGFFDTPPDAPIGSVENRPEPAQDSKKKKDDGSDQNDFQSIFG